jgi:hypothetical protein
MAALLVENTVSDFDAWLPRFESFAAVRESFGVSAAIVWQDAEDPNHVFVLLKSADIEGLRRFVADPQTPERMKSAGVVSTPVFHFLSDARKFEH